MNFAHEFTVNFGAVDRAGIVYYPRFFDFFHRTFEEWFDRCLGVPYSVLINDENVGFPTVRVETDFTRPLPFGERMRVDLELKEIGRRSLTVGYTVTRLSDGETAARATITKVAVDQERFVSIDIPRAWRERFERFRQAE
jgi:4-hydroxybenzoyl-CoA thioesterase